MQKIIPVLWFSDRAEEAANFYASIFPDSKITTLAAVTCPVVPSTLKLPL